MKYSTVDWDSVLTYAQEVYEGDNSSIVGPFTALKMIEEGFEKSRELSDLNLPIYVIYPPEAGEKELYPKTIELQLLVGSPVYVPIKDVVSIGGVASCNLALAVMNNAVKTENERYTGPNWVNLIEVKTRHAGNYFVLLSHKTYLSLMDFWHSTL